MKTIQFAALAAFAAVLATLALPTFAQDVTSGYQRLSDGVYAFTADGGDGGAVVGCEQGTDVKIIVLRDYKTLEKYFCIEQLALHEITDQPVLVSAGFDSNGDASALIMGVPADSTAWPSFYKLNLAQNKVTVDKFETSAIAGVFNEPGEWAFVCPFFARQETRDGFSSIYQTSYFYAMPDGSYAGLLWRETGIWKIEFRLGSIKVDQIYTPAAGQELLPVWSTHRSPKGKLAALVAETRNAEPAVQTPEIAPLVEESVGVEAETETEAAEVSESSDENGGEASESGIEDEVGDFATEPEETPAEENAGGETADEEVAPAVLAVRDTKANLVLITAVGENIKAEVVAESAPPEMVSLALAVDGRPFAFWFTPGQTRGEYSARYWGLGFTDQSKVAPFVIKASESASPPLGAMRALGLPGLMYEENGSVFLRMGNGKSTDWHVQEDFKIRRAAKQFGEVMGVSTTAYFILDGSSLFWHWHKNK